MATVRVKILGFNQVRVLLASKVKEGPLGLLY
jgi:hypothetical protein